MEARSTWFTPRWEKTIFFRLAWIGFAVLLIGLYIANVPARAEQLATVCSVQPCTQGQLSIEEVELLDAYHLSLDLYAGYLLAIELGFAAIYILIAAGIFWIKPDDRMAVFASFTLLVSGTTIFATIYALPQTRVFATLLQPVAAGSILIFIYLFPDGRFIPPATRWLALARILWVIYRVLPSLAPVALPQLSPQLDTLLQAGFYATGVLAQIYRYRRISNPVERQQTKWMTFGFLTAFLGFILLAIP